MTHGFETWVAAFLTLCVFSFLYKDNPFYRFAEHLFVGAAAGYLLAVQYQEGLLPNVFHPLLRDHRLLGPNPLPPGWLAINSALVLIGPRGGLAYFFFSSAHTGAHGFAARVGIWFIMIAFGASFGYPVMARVSLLIARVQF